ncbi:hypothetical protein QM268_18325, partial [Acinetobacter baumannii]
FEINSAIIAAAGSLKLTRPSFDKVVSAGNDYAKQLQAHSLELRKFKGEQYKTQNLEKLSREETRKSAIRSALEAGGTVGPVSGLRKVDTAVGISPMQDSIKKTQV